MIVSRTQAEKSLGKSLEGLGGGKRSYYVLSEDGKKNLGGPYSKDGANKRLGQVERFKENESDGSGYRYVYLVLETEGKLTVYTFSSKDLISPSGNAAEYSYRLSDSVGRDLGTHIFTSKSELGKFVKSSGLRKVHGRPFRDNPRNSIVKDALAREALKYRSFDVFSKKYWNNCSRGILWYPTDEKKFHIGGPEKKKIASAKFKIFCTPELALMGVNSKKKYIAELDISKLPPSAIRSVRGKGGSSLSIHSSPNNIIVRRVLAADKSLKAYRWQMSILPSSHDELKLFWERAHEKAEEKRVKVSEMSERKAAVEARREAAQKKRDAARARAAADAKKVRKGKAKRKSRK